MEPQTITQKAIELTYSLDLAPIHLGRDRTITWCNEFVRQVARHAGCPYFSDKKLMANDMIYIMENSSDVFIPINDEEAQTHANHGCLVIAGWRSAPTKHGHICIIIEGELKYSGNFRKKVPNCANIGSKCFHDKPVSYAFTRDKQPRYWLWRNLRNRSCNLSEYMV